MAKKYQRYIIPLVYTFYKEVGEGALFQQDNVALYTARSTRAMLTALEIECVEWPARSPDLNPIENVWFQVKNWLERHYDLQSLRDEALKRAVIQAQEAVPSDFLLRLALSMPARLQRVIENDGKYIGY